MRLRSAAALATMCALIVTLNGCVNDAGSENSSSSVASASFQVEDSDLRSAAESFVGSVSESGVVSVVDVQEESDTKLIRMTFEAYDADAADACAEAEALCAEYSLQVLQAALLRAQEQGDETAQSSLQEAVTQEEQLEGLGSLYDSYSLLVVMDNSAGTLDVTGARDAGAQGGVNWQ